jgi:hypothetical protein
LQWLLSLAAVAAHRITKERRLLWKVTMDTETKKRVDWLIKFSKIYKADKKLQSMVDEFVLKEYIRRAVG